MVDDEFCWYRAVCVKESENNKTDLFLYDYGREVSARNENIRKLSDKLNFDVLTNQCKVKGKLFTIVHFQVKLSLISYCFLVSIYFWLTDALDGNGKVSEQALRNMETKLRLFEEITISKLEYCGDDCIVTLP